MGEVQKNCTTIYLDCARIWEGNRGLGHNGMKFIGIYGIYGMGLSKIEMNE
jgi:hypothetical protein